MLFARFGSQFGSQFWARKNPGVLAEAPLVNTNLLFALFVQSSFRSSQSVELLLLLEDVPTLEDHETLT